MNCKEGDLALIINSRAGNEGRLVKCVKYVGKVGNYFCDIISKGGYLSAGDYWGIDTLVNLKILDEENKLYENVLQYVSDSRLMPIRFDDMKIEENDLELCYND